ncbi:MAG: hypothetical protein JO112_17670, partial [Planctomycetes bacterium]|nr:hypothetical protein [Planctomycetota bacterium]
MIPISNHRDLVYDATRNLLYITTNSGTVQVYNPYTQAVQANIPVGGPLNGADITPDGSSLYVTDSQTANSTTGVLHQLDLGNFQENNLFYNLASYETGSYDLALGSAGLGLVDGQFNGSGWVPLRQLKPSTNSLVVRTDDPGSGPNGQIRQNTMIHRSADRSLFLFTESNISSGPVFTYNANTNTFLKGPNQNVFLDNALSAVNR